MNPQDRVSLNGMLVFPFSSVETLIEYTDRHKGILVAVNAEKVAKANEETCKIVNDNIPNDKSDMSILLHECSKKRGPAVSDIWESHLQQTADNPAG